ncbi:MAG: iron-containing alcohol dehydrogenase, partial [Desulfobacterales bacterium]
MALETIFSMDTSSIKYGPGVTQEVGWDMEELGAHRVMVVTDRDMVGSEAVSVTLESLQKYNIDTVLFDQARVEPTDVSFKEAVKFAENGKF